MVAAGSLTFDERLRGLELVHRSAPLVSQCFCYTVLSLRVLRPLPASVASSAAPALAQSTGRLKQTLFRPIHGWWQPSLPVKTRS